MSMQDAGGQIERAGDNAGPEPKLSALSSPDPVGEPQNGSRAVSPSTEVAATGGASRSADRPPSLQGVRIPSRNATVRRYVVGLYEACPWLTVADLPAATRWAHLFDRFRRRAEILDRLPVVKISGDDAEPRKLDAEQRATSTAMDRIEAALGITAAARAGLGVDLGRMRNLDAASEVARLRRAHDEVERDGARDARERDDGR